MNHAALDASRLELPDMLREALMQTSSTSPSKPLERRDRSLFTEIEAGRSIVVVHPTNEDLLRRHEEAKAAGLA